jgi:hypothetical protein
LDFRPVVKPFVTSLKKSEKMKSKHFRKFRKKKIEKLELNCECPRFMFHQSCVAEVDVGRMRKFNLRHSIV